MGRATYAGSIFTMRSNQGARVMRSSASASPAATQEVVLSKMHHASEPDAANSSRLREISVSRSPS